MQILFLFLFGGVVCFILYLSYDKHITDKKKVNDEDELKIDLNKYSELIETNNETKEEIPEKVEKEVVVQEEVVKFKAKRNNQNKEVVEEEII